MKLRFLWLLGLLRFGFSIFKNKMKMKIEKRENQKKTVLRVQML